MASRNTTDYKQTELLTLLLIGAWWCAGAQAQTAKQPRQLWDPATGQRWVLRADPSHPGGPGALVPVNSVRSNCARPTRNSTHTPNVIRAGDRLAIDESTSTLDAHLTAVALEPAALGEVILARIGGSTTPMHIVVLGPGRAALATEASMLGERR